MQVSSVFNQAPDHRSYSKHAMLPSDCLIGIEVELEGITSPIESLKYWQTKPDSSLRDGGVEFVLAHPLSGTDLMAAIREFRGAVVGTNAVTSERTSTHVHMDCRDLTVQQVINILVTYTICEAGLFTVCGKDRYENIYCPGLSSAYTQLEDMAKLAYQVGNDCSTETVAQIVHEATKYSCVNMQALQTFGSLEFRGHEGTTSATRLHKWVVLLMEMREFAISMHDPASILQLATELGATAFAERVFDKHTPDVLESGNFVQFFDRNLLNAGDIVHMEEGKQRNKRTLYELTDPASAQEDEVDEVTAVLNKIREYIQEAA